MKRIATLALAATALALSGPAFAAGPEKNIDPSIIEQNKQKKEWMSQGGEREEALTLKPNYDNGREVYEVCSACHMPEGWGLPDGTFPQVAGQHREVIIKQLADIRDGHRDNPTMYPFALPSEIGGTQSIADVSEYIQRMKMSPKTALARARILNSARSSTPTIACAAMARTAPATRRNIIRASRASTMNI
jgi:cytochrome c553